MSDFTATFEVPRKTNKKLALTLFNKYLIVLIDVMFFFIADAIYTYLLPRDFVIKSH